MAINRIEYPLNLTNQDDFSAHGALIEARYRDQSAVPIQVRDGVIPQGVVLQIGGVTYKVDTDETISGTASDYVRVTPNGATATADYVADLTGVLWNSEYNGYYDSQSPARLYLFEEAIAMRNGEIATVVQRYVRQTIDGDVNAGRDFVATRDFRRAGIEGGVAGQGASATSGGAVGRDTSTTNGGAVGRDASSTFGGAVGSLASAQNGGAVGAGSSSTDGGAVGLSASATTGGAVGSDASAQNGGSVGDSAYSTQGGAVGLSASATQGGAVGWRASTTFGGAVGRDASSTNGFSGGDGAVSGDNELSLFQVFYGKKFPPSTTWFDVRTWINEKTGIADGETQTAMIQYSGDGYNLISLSGTTMTFRSDSGNFTIPGTGNIGSSELTIFVAVTA